MPTTTEKRLDYDIILEKIDGFGKWQKCLFALLWLPSGFSAMAVFMYTFIAYLPDSYRCDIPQCNDQLEENYLDFAIPNGEQCYQYQ